MDWRLQGAGIIAGVVLAALPSFFSINYTTIETAVSAWNFIIPIMQYVLISSIIVILLGTVWRGPIGRMSAWAQIFFSVGLGALMLWVTVGLVFYQAAWGESCPDDTVPRCLIAAAEAPAINVVRIGLLIPTLSFVSALAWLFWDDRHRAEAGVEESMLKIRHRRFGETAESVVAAVVASIMMVFGLMLIFVSSSVLLLTVGSSVIGFSIMIFVLEASLQRGSR